MKKSNIEARLRLGMVKWLANAKQEQLVQLYQVAEGIIQDEDLANLEITKIQGKKQPFNTTPH